MTSLRSARHLTADRARERANGVVKRPDGGVYENVIEALGNTPLVRLNSVTRDIRTPVYAKLEMLNPGGSVKDRIGIRMIEEAEDRGWLRPAGTIIEPTSGNTGVGLAMAAAVRGYRCIFVMPDKVSNEKVQLLRAYGAEVVTTPTSVERDDPKSYYSVADRLTREIPNSFSPNQYFNQMNPQAHYDATGPEIWNQTEGKITHLVAGVGTGGTVTGIGRYLKEQSAGVVVVGADPEGSIYTTDNIHQYLIEGVGEDFWPGTFDRNIVDEWVQVNDTQAFTMARRVTREEGILIGGSGGMAVHAAVESARRIDDPDAMVVVVLPDSGRGYLSKIYNDDWMREHGFLARFRGPSDMGSLIDTRERNVPDVIAVACDQTVSQAIALLNEYGVSQLPVVRGSGAQAGKECKGPEPGEEIEVHSVIGSLQERKLLDEIFKDPEVLNKPVREIMEPAFQLIDSHEDIERVIPMLAEKAPAVLVQHEGKLIGIVTRADILNHVAKQR
ncbi:MAG TPA: cystathionine beta-synthase [Thermomicrobiales bacterium]|nr:cystathionine beta-synthase [Thermomicrobiales bacterium]